MRSQSIRQSSQSATPSKGRRPQLVGRGLLAVVVALAIASFAVLSYQGLYSAIGQA